MNTSTDNDQGMHVKQQGFFTKRWKRAKSELVAVFFTKYRKCVGQLKKYLRNESEHDHQRRRSHAKLQPLPGDRSVRRVASKLQHRRPANELERLRKKGENWTANDLFRFQYGDPEAGEPEERKQLCWEWLGRLHAIAKKYCYLAWYESAIYACYYRLAPLLHDLEEKRKVWEEVKKEYAEVFLMGRRIWRRPIHPSRLRVFYDMAMLCVRFGSIPDDQTIILFRDLLDDASNFDFKVLNEVEFANSIEKVVRLENHVIDLFYSRRRSTCSSRSSLRSSRRNTISEHSPTRRGTEDKDGQQPEKDHSLIPDRPETEPAPIALPPKLTEEDEQDIALQLAGLSLLVDISPPSTETDASKVDAKAASTLQVPKIVVEASATPSGTLSRKSSMKEKNEKPASPKGAVRFASEEKKKAMAALTVEEQK